MKKNFLNAQSKIERLDLLLTKLLNGAFSRSRIQTLINEGFVRVNDSVVTSAKRLIRLGEAIEMTVPDPVDPAPVGRRMNLDILYEDDDLLVINKPAGLTVHPGNGNIDATLVNALIYYCGKTLSGIGGVKRPGIVHRLDKNTSGVMVVAKNDYSHQDLCKQFADHGRQGILERVYLGAIWGEIIPHSGTITSFIGRDLRDRTKKAVVNSSQKDARYAITHYHLEEKFLCPNKGTVLAALMSFRLETGRTHQIRVHMASNGHPLLGDPQYGKSFQTKLKLLTGSGFETVRNLRRQFLHAQSLQFKHPRRGNVIKFTAPLPQDLSVVLQSLRNPNGDLFKIAN